MSSHLVPGGDVFALGAEALVNPVNIREAVMGAGLARAVAERWPAVLAPYRRACRSGELRLGTVLATPVGPASDPATAPGPSDGTPGPIRLVVHLPTKDSWRDASRLEWISAAMPELLAALRAHAVRTVAVPALGCGYGQLSWPAVRPVLIEAFNAAPDLHALIVPPLQQGPPRAGRRP